MSCRDIDCSMKIFANDTGKRETEWKKEKAVLYINRKKVKVMRMVRD